MPKAYQPADHEHAAAEDKSNVIGYDNRGGGRNHRRDLSSMLMTISLVLYGRNDNYGYNLHKRAALSLNCMAEVLTDSSDEILFVDYNTPDDFPTFPEAIQDTLTARARDMLRVFRVRPSIHQRFKSKTHLVALEPIARNVAVRRSNPANRWVLSTNTDMIFVPRGDDSLSNIVHNLDPGFYHTPRIEIPEVLWESQNRSAPADIIRTVREWGSTLYLNEIILGAEFILYDGPGDFQLFLRDDLFANHGFHEGMLLGWHVDSNIAKRMYLEYGTVGDLGTKVCGYHCDHTRQVTPAHSHTRLQNDWRRFCHEVDRPDIPEQADTWGCPNDTIEEIRLVANPASIYVQALREAVGGPLDAPLINKYTIETFNKTDYDSRHMVPFLADMFASMPKATNLAWYGAGAEMLSRFAIVWNRLGFTGNILIDSGLTGTDALPAEIRPDLTSERLEAADALLFDFGGLPGSPNDLEKRQLSAELIRRFVTVVREERRRMLLGLPARRLIALNAINNQFERLISASVAAAATPCATHMRHGFVLPVKPKDDWLPLLHIGQAGVRVHTHVDSDPLKLGTIAYGPYKYLDAGVYRLTTSLAQASSDGAAYGRSEPCIVIEIHAGAAVFGVFLINSSDLKTPIHEFVFAVPANALDLISGIETRVMALRRVAVSINALTVESIPGAEAITSTFAPPFALEIGNWLPYLSTGPLGRAYDSGITAIKGPSDFVAFGPYWPLSAGNYELVLTLVRRSGPQSLRHTIRTDVVSDDQQLVAANFHLDTDSTETTIRLPFEVPGESSDWRQIETRIWSSGEEPFQLRSLSVEQIEWSDRRDLFPFLLPGDAGHRTSSGIRNESQLGIVALSPNMRVKPGGYRLRLEVGVAGAGKANDEGEPYAVVLVTHGTELLEITEITASKDIIEQELAFEVPQYPNASSGIEFFFQVTRAADIILRALTIERTEIIAPHRDPAVLRVGNWLPFLHRGKSAHVAAGDVVVSEGTEEFAVYGPYWTLPSGQYEMRASVIPNSQNGRNPVVAGQIAAGEEAQLLADSKWRLGQYRLDPGAAFELRLPFSLSDDLPPTGRKIEARIFTAGDAEFRIRSLTVKRKGADLDQNWFPYLVAGECGLHFGNKIQSVKGPTGYIAYTPRMRVVPGRYRASFDLLIDGPGDDGALALDVWSGSEIVAIVPVQRGRPLTLDITNSAAERGIELRIRAVAPTAACICGLSVERISQIVMQESLAPVLELQDWLPLLNIGPAGRRVGSGVLSMQRESGFVVYGPYCWLASGDYELLVSIMVGEVEENNTHTAARLKTLIQTVLSREPRLSLGGVDVTFDGRQIAVLEGFTVLGRFDRSIFLCLPFSISDTDVTLDSKLEARVWSTGQRTFRICSLQVRKRQPRNS